MLGILIGILPCTSVEKSLRLATKIINHLSELLENKDLKDVKTIFMVGGFSECHLLYNAIKTKFCRLSVIVP
jgi:sulfite exporter TauE/SafE